MIGNIKFIWTEFLCAACSKTYSLQEIRDKEKGPNSIYTILVALSHVKNLFCLIDKRGFYNTTIFRNEVPV